MTYTEIPWAIRSPTTWPITSSSLCAATMAMTRGGCRGFTPSSFPQVCNDCKVTFSEYLAEPVRIAIWHNLPSGGGKRQLYNHVKGLVERGHYVESWCPDSADQSFLPLSALIKENIRPLRKREASWSEALRPLRTVREIVATLEKHCRACAEEIHRGRFDILYAGACLYLRTAAIGRMVELPSAIYLGEPYRWFYEAMPELPWIAPKSLGLSRRAVREFVDNHLLLSGMRVQALEERTYARGFSRILVNSHYSRESILRAYNLDAWVCSLGIDVEKYRPSGESKQDFVLGVGTIYHGKGVDRAIRAVGEIAPQRRPSLIWVGNGSWGLDEFERLAGSLGVQFSARQHVSDAEVISLMSRARAMVYPPRLEPFGLAPLEANACETVVAGIAEAGVRESIREGVNGFLVSRDDPRLLAAAIERILDLPERGAEMGRRARSHVTEHWSLKMGTDQLEAMLTAIASERRHQQ
jgi:glycosyltransferase involved in cell wall biosynthesis